MNYPKYTQTQYFDEEKHSPGYCSCDLACPEKGTINFVHLAIFIRILKPPTFFSFAVDLAPPSESHQ